MFYKILIIAYIPEILKINIIKMVNELENALSCLLKNNDHTFEIIKITDINKKLIIEEMKNIASFLELSNNKAIIYYFGHGNQIRDVNGDELDGKDEIWSTQNILDDEISYIFENINVNSRLYLISDSCSSGSMIDNKINNKNWVSISSSNDIQDSLTSSEGGVFTCWGLIPCLKDSLLNLNINNKIFLSPNDIHKYILNNINIKSQT